MAESSRSLSHVEEPLIARIDRQIYRFARHWLLVFNLVAFFLAVMPFVIPFIAAQGFTGLASWMYTSFGLMCHQMPERTFTIFGEQMALCHRMTAIYVASLAGGVGYAIVRDRLPPLGFRPMILMATPMAIDGFTQLFGLRESVWELRLLTGSLFAIGVMWFALPRLEDGFREIKSVVESRFKRLVREGRSNPL
ncbi:MAG: DUF2085 domain-containing protein [Thermomicrobiaceae bacterium]